MADIQATPRIDGKVAIITGAARGQGEAEAELFVAAGAQVVLTDVLTAEGEAVATRLGERAIFAELDVSSEQNWREVVALARERFGRIDILVNNAGVYWNRPLLEETTDDYLRMLGINLVGAFIGIRETATVMAENGGGAIINVSSGAGLFGPAGRVSYASSKWGLRGLAKVAAVELGPLGVRVNTILPGPIATGMLHSGPDQAERFAQLPLGRYGQPDEVAPLALYLASDNAAFITGAEIVIDGGATSIMGGGWRPPPT